MALAFHCVKKRFWVGVAVFLILFPISVYVTSRQAFLSKVSPSPLRPLPVVDGRVVLGGDRLRLHSAEKCFGVAVCFWIPERDWCVAAAHSCETLPGSGFKANFTLDRCPNSDPDATIVKVVADGSSGLVLSGLDVPNGSREELTIGGSEDIHVGEEALLYSSVDRTTPVQVLGFSMMRDQQVLLVKVLRKEADLGPGASGSPLVQDGRIIGFLVGTIALSFGQLLVLRPACEVYSSVEEIPGE